MADGTNYKKTTTVYYEDTPAQEYREAPYKQITAKLSLYKVMYATDVLLQRTEYKGLTVYWNTDGDSAPLTTVKINIMIYDSENKATVLEYPHEFKVYYPKCVDTGNSNDLDLLCKTITLSAGNVSCTYTINSKIDLRNTKVTAQWLKQTTEKGRFKYEVDFGHIPVINMISFGTGTYTVTDKLIWIAYLGYNQMPFNVHYTYELTESMQNGEETPARPAHYAPVNNVPVPEFYTDETASELLSEPAILKDPSSTTNVETSGLYCTTDELSYWYNNGIDFQKYLDQFNSTHVESYEYDNYWHRNKDTGIYSKMTGVKKGTMPFFGTSRQLYSSASSHEQNTGIALEGDHNDVYSIIYTTDDESNPCYKIFMGTESTIGTKGTLKETFNIEYFKTREEKVTKGQRGEITELPKKLGLILVGGGGAGGGSMMWDPLKNNTEGDNEIVSGSGGGGGGIVSCVLDFTEATLGDYFTIKIGLGGKRTVSEDGELYYCYYNQEGYSWNYFDKEGHKAGLKRYLGIAESGHDTELTFYHQRTTYTGTIQWCKIPILSACGGQHGYSAGNYIEYVTSNKNLATDNTNARRVDNTVLPGGMGGGILLYQPKAVCNKINADIYSHAYFPSDIDESGNNATKYYVKAVKGQYVLKENPGDSYLNAGYGWNCWCKADYKINDNGLAHPGLMYPWVKDDTDVSDYTDKSLLSWIPLHNNTFSTIAFTKDVIFNAGTCASEVEPRTDMGFIKSNESLSDHLGKLTLQYQYSLYDSGSTGYGTISCVWLVGCTFGGQGNIGGKDLSMNTHCGDMFKELTCTNIYTSSGLDTTNATETEKNKYFATTLKNTSYNSTYTTTDKKGFQCSGGCSYGQSASRTTFAGMGGGGCACANDAYPPDTSTDAKYLDSNTRNGGDGGFILFY